jgi:hypothetical protein
VALTNCAARGLIPHDRYLEIGTEIFRSITDEIKQWPEAKPIIADWTKKLLEYLVSNFEDLKAAHKTHPNLVGWLCRVGGLDGVAYGGKQYLAN